MNIYLDLCINNYIKEYDNIPFCVQSIAFLLYSYSVQLFLKKINCFSIVFIFINLHGFYFIIYYFHKLFIHLQKKLLFVPRTISVASASTSNVMNALRAALYYYIQLKNIGWAAKKNWDTSFENGTINKKIGHLYA